MFFVWKKIRQIVIAVVLIGGVILGGNYLLQRYLAHRHDYTVPNYARVGIAEDTERETLFLQTGLGESAINKLIKQNQFDLALELQDAMFKPKKTECVSLLGWFTREDHRAEDERIALVDLQPGDILLTFSTHSVGWRHGHAGLVLDEYSVLESVSLGERSAIVGVGHWKSYSDFVVLRVKDADEELKQEVVSFGREHLNDISYRLLAGWLGEKAPGVEEAWFGAHCSYLIWYAWNRFGYDLDSDGGRLVTCDDILNSDLVEIVQVYGLDIESIQKKNRSVNFSEKENGTVSSLNIQNQCDKLTIFIAHIGNGMALAGRADSYIAGRNSGFNTVITVGESTFGDVVELGVRLMGVIADAAAGF